jgi:2-methylcitrate dehydratase PrpD
MVIDEWVKHILETDFNSFRTETVVWAKERIIDMVGCIIGGANAPGCMAIRDLVKEWDGSKQTTILGGSVSYTRFGIACRVYITHSLE